MLQFEGISRLILNKALLTCRSGTVSLSIPTACALRSVLISELNQEIQDEADLPMPLSMDDMRSWLACANVSSDDELTQRSDETLLRAHKAAGFLQDDTTRAEVLDVLKTVVARAVEHATLEPSKQEEKRTRMLKVLEALPQPAVLAILTAVHQRPVAASATWPGHAAMLLHLLPRPYHPAVVRTCCMSAADVEAHRLVIALPARAGLLQPKAIVSAGSIDSLGFDLTGPERTAPVATTAFRLLAAAAPLAGGSLVLAWNPGSSTPGDLAATARSASAASHVQGSSVRSGSDEAAIKRRCLTTPAAVAVDRESPPTLFAPSQVSGPVQASVNEPGSDWRLPGGDLTHLDLSFDIDRVTIMPPRWCGALAQLRGLRELRFVLTADDLDHGFAFCMPEFIAALRCLPAVESLTVRYALRRRVVLPAWVPARTAPPALVPATAASLVRGAPHLLDTISRMSRLERLDLDRCISFPLCFTGHLRWGVRAARASRSGPTCRAHPALEQLSRLTCLTCLSFCAAVLDAPHREDWGPAFACALRRLPALQELHADLRVCGDGKEGLAEDFVGQLFSGPGLPALEHLDVSMTSGFTPGPHWGEPRATSEGMAEPASESSDDMGPTEDTQDTCGGHSFPVQQISRCLSAHHEALVARLTVLRFNGCKMAPYPKRRRRRAQNTGGAPAGGAHAQLQAAGADRATLGMLIAGMTSLQSLTLSSMALGYTGVDCVARALPALPALTYLDISDADAPRAGLRSMVGALRQAGPGGRLGLRSLCISGACRADVVEVGGLLRHFGGLERVEVGGEGLDLEDVCVLLEALRGLPQLRSVRTCVADLRRSENSTRERLSQLMAKLHPLKLQITEQTNWNADRR